MRLHDFITIIKLYLTIKKISICVIFCVFAHDLYTCTCNDSLTLSKSLFYIKGVQMTTRKKLCTIKGISEAKMEKIKEAANKLCVGVGICFAFLCWVFSRPSTLCTVHLTNIFPSQGFSDRKPMASEDVVMISLSGPWLSDCFGVCRQKKAGLSHNNRQSRTGVSSIIFTYMALH